MRIDPSNPDRLPLRLIEFHAAHHCNLNCASCSHFAPSAPRALIGVEALHAEFRLAGRHISPQFVHILGGEPMLNPNLDAILALSRQQFPSATIKLVTNGVLASRLLKRLLPALALHRIGLAVSLYPRLAMPVDRNAIETACGDGGVVVEFWQQDTFLDFLNPAGDSDAALARRNCSMGDALNVRGDRLYPCPVSAWSDFGGMPLHEDDGIPLLAPAPTLGAVLDRRRVTSKCRYCRPSPPARPHALRDRSSSTDQTMRSDV